MVDADGPIFHYDRRDADAAALLGCIKDGIVVSVMQEDFEIAQALVDIDVFVFDVVKFKIEFAVPAVRAHFASVYF